MTDLTQNTAFVKYAHMVAKGEMARAALDTLYSSTASKEAIEAAYRYVTAPQEPQTAEGQRSAALVAGFMEEAPNSPVEENDEIEQYEFVPMTLCSQDTSVPMSYDEAKACDVRMQKNYSAAEKLGNQFQVDSYWMHERQGWKRLGFDSWEAYYKKRFPNLSVKNSYPLIKAFGVRLRLEAIAEELPAVVNLPAEALKVIATLPEEQQQEAAKRTVEIAATKELHGKALKFARRDKPSTMDARHAVAEMTREVVPAPKPAQRTRTADITDPGYLKDGQIAQIQMRRVVQAQHLSYDPNHATFRIDMCEEAYKDARYLDLLLPVIIGLLEQLNYEVKHVDPFAPEEASA